MTSASAHSVPFAAWYGDSELPLRFPEGWRVFRAEPRDAPALSPEQIGEAFGRPVGCEPLHRLAVGKRSAAIAVDDLTRPTPVHQFLPRMIDELIRGGIPPERIKIIMGTAAHRPMDAAECAKKLGSEVAARFPPVMHDFMGDDIRLVGWVRGGPVYLNRHFLDADLRICVGGVIPHGETGFGGGAKMVVPGLAGRLTISHFHGALPPRPTGQIDAVSGVLDRRAWAEEVARTVGVHAAVCAVVNSRRQLAGLFVGDVVEAHRAAAHKARDLGRTTIPAELSRGCDAVIVNAYPLDTDPIQMGKSVSVARRLGARLTVVINAASDGVFYHGMGMGSGVSIGRLMRNVPGWLGHPTSSVSWLRSMKTALRRPSLVARLSYFSLNALPYAKFRSRDGRRAIDEQAGPNAAAEGEADTLVFSPRFPAWGFRRKYPRGRLYREWDALSADLGARLPRATALLIPCAPLQLLEVE